MITGNDFIALGYKPGKWFKDALAHVNIRELKGDALVTYLDSVKPVEPKVLPLQDSVPYYINLVAENALEQENVDKVIETMDVLMRTPTIVGGAVMPDACPAGSVGTIPVGGVVVSKNTIHPGMHSSDVCCSVMATNFGRTSPKLVLDMAMKTTQFGPGGRKGFGDWGDKLVWNNHLYDAIKENYFTKDYVVKALTHLGTQGDGNHFLFVGTSEATGETWMVTHHGSRGFGASVYKKAIHAAYKHTKKVSPKTLKQNSWLDFDSVEGKLYWEALELVREWTKLNHTSIHEQVLNKVKIQARDRFWNEHNFVFKKGDLFYHAKGATPVSGDFLPEQDLRRIIPLNMAEPVLFVKGIKNDNSFGFAPHGAGRNYSRSHHKRINDGRSDQDIFNEETKGLDVRFFSDIIDISELPSAYKNADVVQDQMKEFNLASIEDRIFPYGCIMAGGMVRNFKSRRK